MPVREDGSYSIADVLRWKTDRDLEQQRQKHERELAKIGDDRSQLNLHDRNLLADAELKEHKLEAARTKVMPVHLVEHLLRVRAAELRKQLLSLTRRLAPRVEGKSAKQVRQLLEEEFARALDAYAAAPGAEK